VKKLAEFSKQHQTISYGCVIGFIVFLNCFGFPIYNLNKEWPLMITLIRIYLVLAGAWFTGGMLVGTFTTKRGFFVICLTVAASCVGLVCRYFLEFGEVSNTYNFVTVNILFHLLVFVLATFFSWRYAWKQNRTQQE
jgi:hypothetical protein